MSIDQLPSRIAQKIQLEHATNRPVRGLCWVWTGSLTAGYGTTTASAGRVGYVHRIVYELLVGPIPEGLELDHVCRVRACSNPDHVDPVTHLVNMRRGYSGRPRRTHCQRQHELAGANLRIYVNPAGIAERHCRACYQWRNTRAAARQVAAA